MAVIIRSSMAEIIITTIQVILMPSPSEHTNSPELSLLKFLPMNYYHSHFLAATFDFTSFFTLAFWGHTPFFHSLLFLIDTIYYIQGGIYVCL